MLAIVYSDWGPSLLSHELCSYLNGKGVAVSHTTSYNPAGNGLVENIVELCGKLSPWLADSRTCTSNFGRFFFLMCSFPYSLFFALQPTKLHMSISSNSTIVPDLETLSHIGWHCLVLYLKCHVWYSKMEPLVNEGELIGADPHFAHIHYLDGRQMTVSTKHLASCGECTHSSLPPAPMLPGSLLEEEPNTHTLSTLDSTERQIQFLVWLAHLFWRYPFNDQSILETL